MGFFSQSRAGSLREALTDTERKAETAESEADRGMWTAKADRVRTELRTEMNKSGRKN